MTKIINLFGGPGCAKSTTAALLFGALKLNQFNCELVTEVAKDFTWSERHKCIRSQPLIFGKQLYRLERLIGVVDYVITDSPILLSAIYSNGYPPSFSDAVVDIFRKFDNVNYFLERVKPYVKIGRSQTEEEAKLIDKALLAFLLTKRIQFDVIAGNNKADWTIFEGLIGRKVAR